MIEANAPRVTLLGSHHRQLVEILNAEPCGTENAAIVVFRRVARRVDGLPDSDRYLSVEVATLIPGWVTARSAGHVAFELAPLRDVFRRCEDEQLVFGFVHSHVLGDTDFSPVDDANEQVLLRALQNRNGGAPHLVALLWTEGRWVARVRNSDVPLQVRDARHVAVVDDFLSVHVPCKDSGSESAEVLARQAAAFGKPFVAQLTSLRIAVVGAGGTGSPAATLLARAGVGELIVIDADTLAKSNLNRVRGARMSDVGSNKAHIAKAFVDSLGLSTQVKAIPARIDESAEAVDALASCDVVFGCTDDQIGRELLTAAVYYYALAYLDTGLGGKVIDGPDGSPILRYHSARISTVLPEYGECLFCQGVLSPQEIRREYALRENPDLTPVQARQRYLEGAGDIAPGVGPFTSAASDFAVASLFDLLRRFRRLGSHLRRDHVIIDFVTLETSSPEQRNEATCDYCGRRSLLVASERARLNRPALGRPPTAL